MATRRIADASTRLTTPVGTPYPAASPIRAAKTVASTAPDESTAGPPESPCRTDPLSAVNRARDGPVPVGIVGEHKRRAADASRHRLQRAVLRVADDRDAHARMGIGEPERRRTETRHGEHGHVVMWVEGKRVRAVADRG